MACRTRPHPGRCPHPPRSRQPPRHQASAATSAARRPDHLRPAVGRSAGRRSQPSTTVHGGSVSNTVKTKKAKKAAPDMGPPVVLAYVYGYGVTYSWHRSIVEMIGWDLANSGSVLQGGTIAMHCGTDGLVEARNKAVQLFLDEGRADWLFWIDTD